MALRPVVSSLFARSLARPSLIAAVAARHASTSAPAPAARPIPPPRGNLATPADFLQAISTPRRGDLQQAVSGLTGEDWNALFGLDGTQLKSAGVTPKQRRFVLWALEKYRQGHDPSDFVVDQKPKKKVRGWGPRVQKGIRVRGRRRPGEK
ncbi:hypothetical protein FA10DRAFT_133996 [Acaromyces ingoldii]|uniref:Small ribosomal subunit protein mS41 n=1 Tax=Acaromyces ingoldii TaxID=215250 RepID=A0A316YIH8_9BASI|nr:hypothetical protein FA10DRAFT_133996 [Acaromyces ingoldii]PWN88981.1 hypothetical protein FA10DRAFT_133996 [Acaromyces ingoldii]